jgi:hypothetical protein
VQLSPNACSASFEASSHGVCCMISGQSAGSPVSLGSSVVELSPAVDSPSVDSPAVDSPSVDSPVSSTPCVVPVDGSGSVATVDAVVSGSGVVVGSGPVVAVVVVVSPSESETLPIPVVASLSPLVGGVVVELVPSDSAVAPSVSPALTVVPPSSPQALKRWAPSRDAVQRFVRCMCNSSV